MARAESMRHGELYAATLTLQDQGASAEEIRQLREQALGSAAADALADLDRQQAAWQRRLSDYAYEQASRFDERERLRVQALDPEL